MKGKRNTLQKRIVFDVFCNMTNHPSAGMVYEEVARSYPSISKATVYRLLAEFAEEGKISRLKLADAADRYDVTTCKHCHIVCRSCGEVADVDVDINDNALVENAHGHHGFFVEDCQVEFVGLCESCYKKNEKNI